MSQRLTPLRDWLRNHGNLILTLSLAGRLLCWLVEHGLLNKRMRTAFCIDIQAVLQVLKLHITLLWVPGYRNIEKKKFICSHSCKAGGKHVLLIGWKSAVLQCNSPGVSSWNHVKGLVKVKIFLYDPNKTEHILEYNREVVRKIIFACMGNIDRQARRLGINPAHDCPGWGLPRYETVLVHFWCYVLWGCCCLVVISSLTLCAVQSI